MNKLAKKAKGQVLAKRKTNISDLKKKGNPDQRLTKTWRGSKTGGEVNFFFLLFIAGVALNPSFSNCDAERSADHNDGETFTQREGEVKVSVKSYQQ